MDVDTPNNNKDDSIEGTYTETDGEEAYVEPQMFKAAAAGNNVDFKGGRQQCAVE